MKDRNAYGYILATLQEATALALLPGFLDWLFSLTNLCFVLMLFE
jgi:hypothetical protein